MSEAPNHDLQTLMMALGVQLNFQSKGMYYKIYVIINFRKHTIRYVRAIPVKFTWEGRNADDFFYYRWVVTDSFYSGGWAW